MCYQLTFFCEKLQQVKSLSRAHLTKVSQSMLAIAERTHGSRFMQTVRQGGIHPKALDAHTGNVAAVVPRHQPDC